MNVPKPKLKMPPPGDWLDELSRRLFGTVIRKADFSRLVENHLRIARQHLEYGHARDAVLRLRLVTWLEPHRADGWYLLGRALWALGRADASARAFRRALKANPKHEEAAYMLAVALGSKADPGQMPRQIPAALASAHFDRLAPSYEREQLEQFGYKGHALLGEALRQAVGDQSNLVILDLGVGTGLMGAQLRPMAAQLVGVDFSPRMLEEAGKLQTVSGDKIYDALVRREAHDFLRGSAAGAYDVIVAAQTPSYIGELRPLFTQVAQALKAGGWFALLADMENEGQDFAFRPQEGRFFFTKPYLAMAASQAGLKVLQIEPAAAYPGEQMWLAVFRK